MPTEELRHLQNSRIVYIIAVDGLAGLTWKDVLKFNIAVLVLALVSLAASFHPQWRLWGLDSLTIFPVWVRISLMLLLLVSALPAISNMLGQTFFRHLDALTKTRTTFIYFTMIGILVALFVLLSSRNHLLGDGYNILGNIAGGQMISPTEPLDYLIHYQISAWLGGGPKGAYWSYALCSYFAGIIFLVFLYFSERNKADLFLILPLLSTFAVVQFFFGYVESYTFSFAFSYLYLLSAWRDLQKEKITALTILALLIASAFHLSAIVLFPSFLYLIIQIYHLRPVSLLVMVAIVLAMAAGLVFGLWHGKVRVAEIFVPLVPTADNPYHLLSGNHLIDLLNLVLLNYPLGILLLLIPGLRKVRNGAFHASAILPAALFAIFVDPKIGAFRDWDLLSIVSAPLMAFLLYAMISWSKSNRVLTYSLVMPLVLFAIVHTGSWIAMNTSKQSSYSRIKRLVVSDPHYSRAYYKGFRNKSWSSLLIQQYDDPKEALRARHERFVGDPDDDLNMVQLGIGYLSLGDTGKAVDMIMANWTRFREKPSAVSGMGAVLMGARRNDYAQIIYEAGLASTGPDFVNLHELGVVKGALGQIDSAVYYYNMAFQVAPGAAMEEQTAFYLFAFGQGFDSIAIAGMTKILPKLKQADAALVKRVLTTLREGNRVKIDSLRILMPKMRAPGDLNGRGKH